MYFEKILPDNWIGVRRNFQKIESNLLGPVSTPTFASLHINSIAVDSTTLLTLESDINNANEYNEILFKVVGGLDYGAIRSHIGAVGGDSYMTFATTTDGGTLVQRMTIQHNGNVGIGTTTPFQKLTLRHGYYAAWETTAGQANSRSWGIRNDYDNYGDFSIRSSDANDNTLDTTRFIIDKDGNIGIFEKLTAGSFGSPADVTNTKQYGFELHYSGNNYDVTGIRSRAQLVTTDASTRTALGGLFQAANNDDVDAGVLMGFMAEAIGKSTANASTISTMRGGLIGTEWGALDTITNLKTLHLRGHSRNAAGAGSFGTGYALYIENEAVGGNGQAYDAGIYFKGTNLSAGNYAFTYGIDFTGGTYDDGDINLSADAMIRADGERVIHFHHDQKGLFVGEDTSDGDIGDENTFIGYHAGKNNDATTIPIPEATGEKNTYVGARSGRGDTGGSDISGSENVGVGAETLRYCTTGYENTCLGDEAGKGITTGHGNCAMGNDAMQGDGTNPVTGNFNVAVGTDTLYVIQSGSYNVAVGYQCLFTTIDDNYNVGIGYQSLYTCDGGENNVGLGYQAGYSLTTGDNNIIFGYQAGYDVTTCSGLFLAGYQAGYGITTNEIRNICIGEEAGRNLVNTAGSEGTYNTFIGYWAGKGTAGADTNRGYDNVGIGVSALRDLTTGFRNVALGTESLYDNTDGHHNFALGYQSLYTNTEGDYNVAIGAPAMRTNLSGNDNVGIGYLALHDNSVGNNNMAIGNYALTNMTSATGGNVAVGTYSLQDAVSGYGNAGIGYYSLGACNVGSTGNIGIGYNAGRGAAGARNYGISIGFEAGRNLTTGGNSVFIGKEAGKIFTSGTSNVMIGFEVGKTANGIISAATDSNLLTIGNQDPATNLPLIEGYFAAHASGPKLIVNGTLELPQRAGATVDGDLWNDSAQKALQTFVSGIEQTLTGVIFTQTADQVIANTTTETTMFGTGVGTLTLPANFWTVGKTIRIEIHGDFADTGNPTAEIQAYYGATSLIDSGAITLSGLGGTEEWETEIIITCRSVGATGTVETIIDWEYETTTGSSAIERLDVAGVLQTIDTTASGVLDATFQWGTAAAANTLHSHVGFVEVLN